jgi:hypothetical protein
MARLIAPYDSLPTTTGKPKSRPDYKQATPEPASAKGADRRAGMAE